MKKFTKKEAVVREFLKKGTKFKFNNKEYTIKLSGKPKSQKRGGEPKTDIYVFAESVDDELEIRLSYKMKNHEFLENKMSSIRAEQIFGTEWKNIIKQKTREISEAFQNREIFYRDRLKNIEEGSMTLGWRFELFNNKEGKLSGLMTDMTIEQVYEVYAGENLEDIKRDAKVNGKIIKNSGIAEYILVTNEIESTQNIIDQMVPIRDYIIEHPDVYFGCKALNYRTKSKKMDGNRPLAVQVNWYVESNKLKAELDFNNPLTRNGNEMKDIVNNCLNKMNKKDATQINDEEIVGVKVQRK